jgi:hypothetical protein
MADNPSPDQPGRRAALSRFFRSDRKNLLVEHVLREVRAGRDLGDVMDDPFVRNRADAREQRALLDDKRVTAAVADSVLADLRGRLDAGAS